MADTTSLYTRVKNISGAARHFGYLGPHGVTLAANGIYSIFGSLTSFYGRGAIGERKRISLELDLLADRIEILNTNATIVADPDTDPEVDAPVTQATVSATGGGSVGGALAAGKYKVAYTFVNEWGETGVGTSASAEFTVAAGNIPRVTLPAKPAFITGLNIYITDTGVSASDITTLHLYASAVDALTFDLSAAQTTLGVSYPAPPTTNTTAGRTPLALTASNDTPELASPSWIG